MTERSRLANLAMKPKRLGSAGEAGAADADKPKRLDRRRTERALPTRKWFVSEPESVVALAQRPSAMLGKRSAEKAPEPKRTTRPNAGDKGSKIGTILVPLD